MGGGGFSASPGGDPALDRYVLEVAERPNPRICLLPTASGDPEEQIQRFYRAYHDLPCEPTHLSLFRLGTKPVDLRAV
ncbi:MAG: dipeptidase, partial [Thermoleophilaceae bacterium]|nr:dipeptidase [Thermoleophilaceae bacterium]